MVLGRLLFLLRMDAGLTQRQAAHQARVTPNYLSMVEHARTTPTEATLAVLARVYGCELKTLLLACADQVCQQRRGLCEFREAIKKAPGAEAWGPGWDRCLGTGIYSFLRL